MNREFAERRKERKDAKKWRRDRKRKDREAREKENQAQEKEVKSPLPSPETTPEPESSPSEGGEVDYSSWPDPNVEAAGGQSPGQRGAGTEPPAQAEGESPRARLSEEGLLAQADAGTLERVSPPRHQTSPGAAPGGCSTGASGSARAPKRGSRKRKLDAASG